ncbi:hypothetical protein ACFXD5_06965 [Streptomyces sp. NPDC059385]|uniref:hypothetical protein n=1 Tax=Streptomyces sp. NPDC059385 TaxID=3346817 RepID=UPI00368B7C1C
MTPSAESGADAREPGRETVRITRPEQQGHVLLCAYSALGNGFGSFRGFGAHVIVTDGRGSTVTVGAGRPWPSSTSRPRPARPSATSRRTAAV